MLHPLSQQTEPRFQFGRYFYIRIGLLYLSDPVLVHILDLASQLLYALPSLKDFQVAAVVPPGVLW